MSNLRGSAKIILITLIHNRKHLVGKALQSAANQKLPKDKWIHLVMDNASTDGAALVGKAFCKKYDNMHFLQMGKNLGQQKAFNHALYNWIPANAPNVEVWANLDSDDLIEPFALNEILKVYEAHPEIGGSYSGFGIIDKRGSIIVKDHAKARLMDNQFTEEGQKLLRQRFVGNNPCGHMRAFKISALLDVGGFNTNYEYATDYNVFGRLLLKYPVVKINKVLYYFRQHGDQVEGKSSPQQTKDWKDMQEEFTQLFTERGLI